jgi:hypothetical protein
MAFYEKNGLRYYQFDIFQGYPLFHAVLTRQGGYSQGEFASLNTGGTVGDDPEAVLKNHQKIYHTFDYPFDSRFDVWQVHGKDVICTDEPRELGTLHTKADGILTQNPDVTLFMRFADCVPILLYDPVKQVIGIAHAGWQGTHKQVARETVEKMVACYGSEPADILAGIGPSICQHCYEVGQEPWDAFRASFGEEQAHRYFERRGGRLYLDLWQANQDVLMAAGVTKIEIAGLCTAEHLDDWYSHRAEKGMTGRFAVLMSIDDN